eukprot:EC784637.1.p2 GENE.EC784637.1~~EC784637.1.p2  ORF type:complete len:62 (-),score=11.82 EC784637.1:164-349(-)
MRMQLEPVHLTLSVVTSATFEVSCSCNTKSRCVVADDEDPPPPAPPLIGLLDDDADEEVDP